MPPSRRSEPLQVALLGNPNTGKSTLFSALVGVHQRVGNYPGVTVEKRTGSCECDGHRLTLVDLPGLYSLSPRSRDELVAVEVLLGHFRNTAPVDAVVCIVDASNLERNLYLVSQVLDLGLPTIVALNMLDVAEDQGVTVDAARLEQRLGVPVVPMQAHRGIGVERLKEALGGIGQAAAAPGCECFPAELGVEVARLAQWLNGRASPGAQEGPGACGECAGRQGRHGRRHRHRRGRDAPSRPLPPWFVQRLVFDVSGNLRAAVLGDGDPELDDRLEEARQRLAAAGCPIPGVETAARYAWVRRALEGAITRPADRKTGLTDRVDRVLTHRVWGTALFALVVVMIFQAVYVWAEPFTNGIETGTRLLGQGVESMMGAGALRSLLVDGVLSGVGAILAFMPQILVLFLLLALLEDCGYLARAAFLVDALMARVGLSGKSFIPLLSSFACAVPGIMGTRVIENERDRLTTILVAPLMTCSARLPIFTLLIAAFIPGHRYLGGLLSLQGLTLVAMYFLGIATAVAVAHLFKRTILRGDAPPFLMELPAYKWPSLRTVALRVLERGLSFLRYAGTMIAAISILVWAALYWPHDAERVEAPFREARGQLEAQLDALDSGDPRRAGPARELAVLDHRIDAAYQQQSYLGRLGQWIEPAFRPLGWDWRIGTAVIASLPAREIVVATLGVIFQGAEPADGDAPEEAGQLRQRLQEATREGTSRPLFSIPVALSLMVFYALCAQCAATLAVIRQETRSWRWPAFTFLYMTALAYGAALLVYQVGSRLG